MATGFIRSHRQTATHIILIFQGVIRKSERAGNQMTNIAENFVFFIDAKVLKHFCKVDELFFEKKKLIKYCINLNFFVPLCTK